MTENEQALLQHPLVTDPSSAELRAAMEAAFSAAQILRDSLMHCEMIADEKEGERGLVTRYDREAEARIREILSRKTNLPMLGEESGLQGDPKERLWVVDPIDGTTNFSRGIPLCAIAIGLVESNDVVLGVVYNPFMDECFFARKGRGAFRNGQPIKVTPSRRKGKPVVFLNSGYSPEFEACAAELTSRLQGNVVHRHFGTTALEICYVAAGRADAFTSIGDELWDYAAAVSVAFEAGATVVDWESADWTIRRSDIVVAAPHAWPLLQKHVTELFSSNRTLALGHKA